MSENMKISKADLISANAVKNAVGPASDALAKIRIELLDLSVNETKTLAQAAKILGNLNEFAQGVIDLGDMQFQSRDVATINKASNRFFAIDRDIEECKAHQLRAEKAFLEKSDDLRQRGYTTLEIKNLVDIPGPEVDVLQARIEALMLEKAKVKAFLDDYPRFSVSLLDGTAVAVIAEPAQAA